jgi:hypothetical protein
MKPRKTYTHMSTRRLPCVVDIAKARGGESA